MIARHQSGVVTAKILLVGGRRIIHPQNATGAKTLRGVLHAAPHSISTLRTPGSAARARADSACASGSAPRPARPPRRRRSRARAGPARSGPQREPTTVISSITSGARSSGSCARHGALQDQRAARPRELHGAAEPRGVPVASTTSGAGGPVERLGVRRLDAASREHGELVVVVADRQHVRARPRAAPARRAGRACRRRARCSAGPPRSRPARGSRRPPRAAR